jgi:hypothetical protein
MSEKQVAKKAKVETLPAVETVLKGDIPRAYRGLEDSVLKGAREVAGAFTLPAEATPEHAGAYASAGAETLKKAGSNAIGGNVLMAHGTLLLMIARALGAEVIVGPSALIALAKKCAEEYTSAVTVNALISAGMNAVPVAFVQSTLARVCALGVTYPPGARDKIECFQLAHGGGRSTVKAFDTFNGEWGKVQLLTDDRKKEIRKEIKAKRAPRTPAAPAAPVKTPLTLSAYVEGAGVKSGFPKAENGDFLEGVERMFKAAKKDGTIPARFLEWLSKVAPKM